MTQQKIYAQTKNPGFKRGDFDPATGNLMIDCPCCTKRVPSAEIKRSKGPIIDGIEKIYVTHWDKGFRTKKHKCPHGNECSASRNNRFNSGRKSGRRASDMLGDCPECRAMGKKEGAVD